MTMTCEKNGEFEKLLPGKFWYLERNFGIQKESVPFVTKFSTCRKFGWLKSQEELGIL